jgi:DNA-binding phage protein
VGKYKKFDVVDFLKNEEDFEMFVAALREDGASEGLIEKAYRDIERARIVHNVPEPEPAVAL